MTVKKAIAFDFVLEELYALDPIVKPMFGCHAIYVHDKIVLITRNKSSHREDNGVWIATSLAHHESLRKKFPSMRRIHFLGSADTNWQNIPAEANDFEESVVKICALIRKGDPRIGTVPKARKKRQFRNPR